MNKNENYETKMKIMKKMRKNENCKEKMKKNENYEQK